MTPSPTPPPTWDIPPTRERGDEISVEVTLPDGRRAVVWYVWQPSYPSPGAWLLSRICRIWTCPSGNGETEMSNARPDISAAAVATLAKLPPPDGLAWDLGCRGQVLCDAARLAERLAERRVAAARGAA